MLIKLARARVELNTAASHRAVTCCTNRKVRPRDLATLAVTNLIGLPQCDMERRFSFPNACYGLFSRRIREINAEDFGNFHLVFQVNITHCC